MRFLHRGLLAVLVSALTGIAGTAMAQVAASSSTIPTPGLFVAPPLATVADPASAPRGVLRRRAVGLDVGVLESLASGLTRMVRLDLFEGVSFTGIVDHIEVNRPGMISIHGRLAEDSLGEFDLVRNGGAVVGAVRSPRLGRVYPIGPSPEGVHTISEMPQTGGGCGVDHAEPPPVDAGVLTSAARSGRRGRGQPSCGDDGPLAVLVLYTGIARAAAGGTAAIQAQIQHAVNVSNTAYQNSLVGMRMRLAHAEEVPYDEIGTYTQHLDRLEYPGDGIMDGMAALRDKYGADTVVLIVEKDEDAGDGRVVAGIANQMDSSLNGEATAFAVVCRTFAADTYTLVHEVGHNLGLEHDRSITEATPAYPYARGFVFFVGTEGRYASTVMAYTRGDLGIRIPHFSNPSVLYADNATGHNAGDAQYGADNALALNNIAPLVTNWRRNNMWVRIGSTGVQSGCVNEPYGTVAAAVNAAPWTGAVVINAGVSRERLTISKPLVLAAYGGTAIIGRN